MAKNYLKMHKTKLFNMLILLSLYLNSNSGYSQAIEMEKEVEETLRLGKDSIVTLALELINESVHIDGKANRENFADVKVMTDGKEIFVSFTNPIIYVSRKTSSKGAVYASAEVAVLGKKAQLSQVSNASNSSVTTITFYKETKKAKRDIEFILEAINNSDEIGSIDDLSTFKDNMIIYEYKDYYDINVESTSTSSFYKIEKKSGKIFDAQHKHKQIEPDPSDNKKEIQN